MIIVVLNVGIVVVGVLSVDGHVPLAYKRRGKESGESNQNVFSSGPNHSSDLANCQAVPESVSSAARAFGCSVVGQPPADILLLLEDWRHRSDS